MTSVAKGKRGWKCYMKGFFPIERAVERLKLRIGSLIRD